MTEFYIVRHGQTRGNVTNFKQGQVDEQPSQLDETGIQQAKDLHDNFDISFADRIIVSPLTRAKDTADILNAGRNLPIQIDKRLLEISYGDWDGRYDEELKAKYGEYFIPGSNAVYPSYYEVSHGEKFTDVEKRVAEFTAEMHQKYAHEKIIIVTHGFTVRSFAQNAVKAMDPLAFKEPANCSVTKIEIAENEQQGLFYYGKMFH
ncbi:histidine phosphatase family protein [Pediococcus cellicola]|uniref:Phosphoglycerate mutase n=1 Tax=Pediococcus cellicola TaxID=319652 RepID=A0A0R2IQ11_9LACO|nr:histidine phosphatase family protein [Pediococcus cellicola]KRN65462.1 phosphoglycerate mutase [Pediococcus cellicola]GEL15362.1 fructose 2,6-bisphosphatase [Pediococcus cellicola]